MVYFCRMMSPKRPYNLKKSLGQHFLKDESVCRQIVDSIRQYPVKQLLEIGPGGGAITKYFMTWQDIDFKAVEIDREKVAFLKKNYPALNGRLLEMDFLQMERPFEGSFTIVGNFPYNISTEILFKVLEWREHVEHVTGMFQKEVAQRIAAPSGNKIYGVTSVLLQAFFEVEWLFEVSEQAFNPPPKVKSAVIRLTPRAQAPNIESQKKFFLLVKTAFNQRRKTLRNAVKGLFTPEVLADSLFDRRAEQLTLAEFAALTWKMGQ
jgi:16S rRNA (adenine1518-N6/adenine1519-N6)-dimethyltransferase